MSVRGTTTQRGYGAKHQAERKRWAPYVEAGQVMCHAKLHTEACHLRGYWLGPDTPWDLGHTEDRSGYTGPEFRGCNRADGARRRNKLARDRRGRPSRRRRIL